MFSPAAKRQRSEDTPITRSDIWYKDGSVVLQAHGSQFRVHWSILSKHSTFFRDLEALPQPPDQPTVDGCPVVELADDAAQDVEYLFEALYSPTFLTQKTMPFAVVAALVRLGRKYDFREVLDTTVQRITYENPMTLTEFDALHREEIGSYRTTQIVHYNGILYDILTLARECNILTALPCAYLRCIHYQTNYFNGVRRADGTTASLAAIDIEKCFEGRQKLMQLQWQDGCTLSAVRAQHYEMCRAPEFCSSVRFRLMAGFLKYGSLVPFWAPSRNVALWNVCVECKQHLQASMTEGRKKMWAELPALLGLASWNELKNDI